MAAITLCFINQKGGCGKSSTCFHLAGALARRALRVLLVDMDPQGSLSQGFFGSALIENLPPAATSAALFVDEAMMAPPSLTVATAFAGIDIIRANHTLAPFNEPCPEQGGLRQFHLRSCVAQLTNFDFILIDCPPNLYQCSWNALLASDFVVVPVPPEDFATQGLRFMHQAIIRAQILNDKLRLLGHLVTRMDARLLVHRCYEQKLRDVYDDQVLATVIPEASAYKVSLACRQPVSWHNPRSKAALLIDQLAAEILARTQHLAVLGRVA